MRVGIIGMGTVGCAMQELFGASSETVTYDAATDGPYPTDRLASCELAVVCVDTPMGPHGECDTSNVEAAVDALPVSRVLLRSTVAPGTTDRLSAATGKQICFSPEYIGETSFAGVGWGQRPGDVPFMVIGGPPAARSWMLDRLVSLLGPAKTYFQCSALEAELIKYMENSFLATKVAFVNEFYEICRAFSADWHTVREGWLLDPRIGSSHSAVFPDDRGFGGRCLPKDLNAIVASATAAGYRPELLAEVLATNRRHRGSGGDSVGL